MNTIYRFILEAETGGSTLTRTAQPIYKDDLAISYAREGDNKFFRRKLSGSLTFIDADFDFIVAGTNETYFYVTIQKAEDSGAATPVFADYWKGRFAKSDCTFNLDDRNVQVQPEVYDQYTKVMAAMDAEYDIIKLSPQKWPLDVRKKPLLDVGMIEAFRDGSIANGAFDVTRYQGGEYREESVDYDNLGNNAITRAGFRQPSCVIFTLVFGNGAGTPTYKTAGTVGIVASDIMYDTQNYVYFFSGSGEYVGEDGNTYEARVTLCPFWTDEAIIIVQTVSIYRAGVKIYTVEAHVEHGWPSNPLSLRLAGVGSVTGAPTVEVRAFSPSGRWMTDVTDGTSETIDASADDVVGNEAKYKYIHKAGVLKVGVYYDFAEVSFFASAEKSDEATDWGQDLQGKFFVKPEGEYYPMGRSSWRDCSFWFTVNQSAYNNTATELTAHYTMPDAYSLSSVLSRLLAEIDPDVTHKSQTAYSELLYAATNPVSGGHFDVMLTPKSNITSLGYTQAAQKGAITLGKICDMLANVWQAYWFIDDEGRFRIEQARWFVNGGAYTGGKVVGTDLTAAKQVRNGKTWAFATSKYKFDKEKIPERLTFSWADDVSADFAGEDIVVLSRMAAATQKEEHKIGDFTSDVDYMLLHPGDISKDGFALFASVAFDILPPSAVGTSLIQGADGYTGQCPIERGYGGNEAVFRFSVNGVVSRPWLRLVFWTSDTAHYDPTDYAYVTDGHVVLEARVPDDAIGVGLYAHSGSFTSAELLTATILGRYELPEVIMYDAGYGNNRSAQNGYLAMRSLQPIFWRDEMPSRYVQINGESNAAVSVRKSKVQEVSFPAGQNDPDTNNLIRTYLGDGEVGEMNVTLTSRYINATLEYEP